MFSRKRIFMRRFAVLILAAALTVCSVGGIAAENGTQPALRNDETQSLYIINQIAGAAFNAADKMNRENFCTVISKAFLGYNGSQTELPFEDAGQIKPQNTVYLAALYDAGVLKGSPGLDGKLYMLPEETITRQEAFTLLGRLLDITSDFALTYTDTDGIADYAKPYISWFTENGILLGYPDGSVGPRGEILGGHMALFVLRAMDVKFGGAYITTLAGTGIRGFENGIARESQFTLPYGVAVTDNGTLVVLDTYNNLIRVVSRGVVATFLGTAEYFDENRYFEGFYIDGTLEEALLNRPVSGLFNSTGDFIFADSGNGSIRIILGEHVYTLSGTTQGYKEGADDEAQYDTPAAIAIDERDNVYIADTLNNCIRKIDTKGNSTLVAGTPQTAGFADGSANNALFNEPSGIAVSSDGSVIYVADTGNHLIRKIENGTVTTIAGAISGYDSEGMPFGGYADAKGKAALFDQPQGLALVGGLLLVADCGNNAVRAIVLSSGETGTVIGNGTAGDEDGNIKGAALNHPRGLCYCDGLLYVADTGNNKIKVATFDAAAYEEDAK